MRAPTGPRALAALAAIVASIAAARPAGAQNPLSRARGVAQKAVNATNRQITNEQKVEEQGKANAAKPVASTAAKPPAGKSAAGTPAAGKAAATKAAPTKGAPGTPGKKTQGTSLDVARAESATPPVTLMREAYEYDAEGRRDPFMSLLNTSELRPGMSDLRLTGILYDPSGRHSVATLRDLGTNALYRATIGTTLGRMHVSAIRVKAVVFTIDEFGTTRQDSLVLGDTTRGRPR